MRIAQSFIAAPMLVACTLPFSLGGCVFQCCAVAVGGVLSLYLRGEGRGSCSNAVVLQYNYSGVLGRSLACVVVASSGVCP